MYQENGWGLVQRSVESKTEEFDGFQLTRLSLRIPNLAPQFDGYKIVQLTDLHYGPVTSAEHIRRAVKISSNCNPDVVVLTGDYLQLTSTGFYNLFATKVSPKMFRWKEHRRQTRHRTEELAQILGQLQAPDGVFAVVGNHDYMEGVGTVRRKLGPHISWLINQTASISRNGAQLLIGGIDDDGRGKPDLNASLDFSAFENSSEVVAAKVLLAHNPDVLTYQNAQRISEVDLLLAGHTHGGQICLPWYGPLATRTVQKKHVRGLSWYKNTPVFVSNGAGYGAITVRILCPPEVVVIELCR